jgi:hypothetical protein
MKTELRMLVIKDTELKSEPRLSELVDREALKLFGQRLQKGHSGSFSN